MSVNDVVAQKSVNDVVALIKYEMVEVNDKAMSWVRIVVPKQKEPLRWVSGQCGVKDLSGPPPVTDGGEEPPAGGGPLCSQKNTFDSYVLAMSWQPAFCEYLAKPGDKPECEAMERGDLVIDHLTLHGLWPNKKVCGTGYGNCAGPNLSLDDTTVSQLSPWMPNFFYEDELGTHEWEKHGRCQERTDDDYFLTALRLLRVVDASEIGAFIKARSGGTFTVQEFFNDVAQAYGPDVAARVQLVCAKGTHFEELRMNLPKAIPSGDDLRVLTADAPPFSSRTDKSCKGNTLSVERMGRKGGGSVFSGAGS